MTLSEHLNQRCRSKDFYTIKPGTSITRFEHMRDLKPTHIEESFHFYEREYSKVIGKIKNRLDKLELKDAKLLIYAIVDFKIRNNYFRDKVVTKTHNEIFGDDLDKLKEKIISSEFSFPNTSIETMLDTIEKLQREFAPIPKNYVASHLSTLASQRTEDNHFHTTISAHLLQFRWTVFTSKNKFISNDNPGVSLDENDTVQNTKFDEGFIFFFPLTPSLCLAINSSNIDLDFQNLQSEKSLNFSAADNEFIDFINDIHCRHLSRYIFSDNSEVIREIASKINISTGNSNRY